MDAWMTPNCPILIVEDNGRERELIASAITSYDLSRNVLSVGSGAEVMDYFGRRGEYADRDSLPCLVILDLDLTDMHGLEVLR
jgi:CheY-like chemotaxis protein